MKYPYNWTVLQFAVRSRQGTAQIEDIHLETDKIIDLKFQGALKTKALHEYYLR